jgi:hypothetical protein
MTFLFFVLGLEARREFDLGKPVGIVGTALLITWLSRGRLRPTAGWGRRRRCRRERRR